MKTIAKSIRCLAQFSRLQPVKSTAYGLALVFTQTASAQNAAPVIEAEKAFAQMAVKETMRKAFLKNLDSSGVTFNEGKIYNGLAQFTAAKESSIKLLWHPFYACVSSSGDIGFTTGPYEVRKTMEGEVLAAGQYSSVWKKNAQGEWKLLVDLGTDYKTSLYDNLTATASFSGLVPPFETSSEYSDVEKAFIKSYEAKGPAAFEAVLHEGSWCNVQNRHPFSAKAAIEESLKTLPDSLRFTPVGSGVSSAKDMIYVYGEVEHQGRKENYMRVWAHTKAGWMILLQVLKW